MGATFSERKELILEELAEDSSVSVDDLAKRMGVSEDRGVLLLRRFHPSTGGGQNQKHPLTGTTWTNLEGGTEK